MARDFVVLIGDVGVGLFGSGMGMDGLVERWKDGEMDGWKDGWRDGRAVEEVLGEWWVAGWVFELLDVYVGFHCVLSESG